MDHRRYMAMLGRKGGKTAMSKLTPEERKEKSRLATAHLTKKQRVENARKAALVSAKKRRERAKKNLVYKSA